MLFILAVAVELFVDWIGPSTPLDQAMPVVSEIRAELASKGWDLHRFEGGQDNIWVFWNLGEKVKGVDFSNQPKEKLILFMWEPPTMQPELYAPETHSRFGKVFTWDDDLVDGKKYFKFHYPVLLNRIENIPSFDEKKFCTMIARKHGSKHPNELYSEREKAARFFETKPGKFDLYGGGGWSKKKYKNYKGAIPDKIAVLKDYKFSICYENMKETRGYVTEKIFDCFAAGVVPIYWGASNITDYVPENCFIDRRKFKDTRELYKFLKRVTKEEYENYLRNAEVFLKSDQAKLFSAENFLRTFLKISEEGSL